MRRTDIAGSDNNRWLWTGPFYQAEGSPAVFGRISYVIVSPIRYDRVFESVKDGVPERAGADTCVKT